MPTHDYNYLNIFSVFFNLYIILVCHIDESQKMDGQYMNGRKFYMLVIRKLAKSRDR